MKYNNTVTIANIDLNYDDFRVLNNYTNFDISEILWDVLRGNPKREFIINDIKFAIDPPMFMGIHDCDGTFSLFVSTDDANIIDDIASNETLKHLIHDRITNLVSDIKNHLNEIKIPTTKLKNVIYSNEQFYVSLGCKQPEILTLDCTFEQTIDDLCWT